ncbi:hypothetical protein M3J09_007789 [Ascochyta lentis]
MRHHRVILRFRGSFSQTAWRPFISHRMQVPAHDPLQRPRPPYMTATDVDITRPLTH